MNKLILISFFLVVLFASCCRDKTYIETGKYPLSDAEQQLIPYELGDSIAFKHSNGYEFYLKVTQNSVQWIHNSDFCEWSCCNQDYYTTQEKTTVLESSYPDLTFTLQVTTVPNDYYGQCFSIGFNQMYNAYFGYDSLLNFTIDSINAFWYDSVVINNSIYTCVIEQYFYCDRFITDSALIRPKSLFYNDHGLLQLKMTNNETYSINE
jgi:hypothetical protein